MFVTDDSRMKDGLLDISDRVALNQAGAVQADIITTAELVHRLAHEESGQVPSEPSGMTPEGLRAIGEAVNQSFGHYEGLARRHLGPDGAIEVRQWRVGSKMSWRAIARRAGHRWNDAWGSTQFMGMALCKIAAEQLGEDYRKPPWNDAADPDPVDLAILKAKLEQR